METHAHLEIREKIKKVKEICADERSKEIYQFLTDAWWQEELSDDYFDSVYIDIDKEYFDDEIFKLTDHESFVDAGAYIGDTAAHFLQKCQNKYQNMYLFELDKQIYQELQTHISETFGGDVSCYPYGLGKENAQITYSSGNANSTIKENGYQKDHIGEIRRLDDILADKSVTLIKMDIEGAEMDALLGAKKIIQEQRPTLAICMYHSVDDMLNIPILIKQLVPEYRIYIRHYAHGLFDTVCYAVI